MNHAATRLFQLTFSPGLICFLMLVSGYSAQSQDQDFERSEISIHLYPEENSKTDADFFTPRTHGQDSSVLFSNSHISRSVTKPGDAKSNDEEEALKFNFLYFIIQKFKISDIID